MLCCHVPAGRIQQQAVAWRQCRRPAVAAAGSGAVFRYHRFPPGAGFKPDRTQGSYGSAPACLFWTGNYNSQSASFRRDPYSLQCQKTPCADCLLLLLLPPATCCTTDALVTSLPACCLPRPCRRTLPGSGSKATCAGWCPLRRQSVPSAPASMQRASGPQ